MENKLKTAVEHLNLADFTLPVAKHNAEFGKVNYDEYIKNSQAVSSLKILYNSMLRFGVLLILNLNEGVSSETIAETIKEVEESEDRNKEDKLVELKERAEEIETVESFVPTYIRYMFYRAIALAQNGVVYPYIGDEWHTDELAKLMQEIGKEV